MGMVTVQMGGSFGNRYKTFSAMAGGHAQAVAEAIQYLAEVELPKAIRNDHECHRDGIEPAEGFAKMGKGLLNAPSDAT